MSQELRRPRKRVHRFAVLLFLGVLAGFAALPPLAHLWRLLGDLVEQAGADLDPDGKVDPKPRPAG